MPTQTCECIKVTYTLVGEEPVTVEVESSGTNEGKPSYSLPIGNLLWTADDSGNWLFKNLEDVLQAFLSSTNNCPFGTYNANPSIFEAFEVQSCITEEDPTINCYRLAVWKEQCEYAQCVLKYLTQLQFGINNCEALEKLKNKRRVLNILNCYDPRDILNDTTEYNSITYTEIKQLLNYL